MDRVDEAAARAGINRIHYCLLIGREVFHGDGREAGWGLLARWFRSGT